MTSNKNRLQHGPLGDRCFHICVDMQRLFAEDTPWRTPWLQRVLPRVSDLVGQRPERTIFTRFIPALRPAAGVGAWRRYYERWPEMTLECLGPEMIEIVGTLRQFVPPAAIVDKQVYSPWMRVDLTARLRTLEADTLIISGGETDVCVLATVLGAVDRGYRVVLATDALCSSSDETHDALLSVYENRFSQQIEAVSTACILEEWR
jgi:nicotinamidase-related amidase